MTMDTRVDGDTYCIQPLTASDNEPIRLHAIRGALRVHLWVKGKTGCGRKVPKTWIDRKEPLPATSAIDCLMCLELMGYDGYIEQPKPRALTGWRADVLRKVDAFDDLLTACKVTLRLMRRARQTHETCCGCEGNFYLDQCDTGLSGPLSGVLEAAIAKAKGRA